jgi:hypothetical protein
VSERRENVRLEAPQDFLRGPWLPLVDHRPVPITRNVLERILLGKPRLACLLGFRMRRIGARSDQLSRFSRASLALLSRFTERHNGECAKVQLGLPAVGPAILHSRMLAAGRGHFKIQSAAVGKLVSLVPGLCVDDLKLAQRGYALRHFGGILSKGLQEKP